MEMTLGVYASWLRLRIAKGTLYMQQSLVTGGSAFWSIELILFTTSSWFIIVVFEKMKKMLLYSLISSLFTGAKLLPVYASVFLFMKIVIYTYYKVENHL